MRSPRSTRSPPTAGSGDCLHRQEPGCAVRAAVDAGRLPAIRLTHYLRLDDERAQLVRRRDELARLEEKKRARVMHRALRKMYTSS